MSSDISIQVDDGKRDICFEIDGVVYFAIVSLGQLLLPNVDVDASFDYRNYVSSQLVSSVYSEPRASLQQVISQEDDFFVSIFDSLLRTDADYYAIYDCIETSGEICKRYATAYHKYCLKMLPQSLNRAKKRIEQTLSSLSTAISWYANNVDLIKYTLETSAMRLYEISRLALDSIVGVMPLLWPPELSDDQRNKLIEAYRQWGRYGWTCILSAPIKLYNRPPLDINEANARVKQYCTPQCIDILFDDLREQRVRKEDLESAIHCFTMKEYKACSLILFGLIDAKLIRLQPKRRDRRRPSGSRAVNKLIDQFGNKLDEVMIYTTLRYVNLFECLKTIFSDGDDFSREPAVINRNFVDHGMNTKRVRKRDCIQLFLVLNNLMIFLSDEQISREIYQAKTESRL